MNILLNLIIDKYNALHIALLIFFPAFIVASYFIFRNKSQKAKDIYMYVLMGLTFFFAWSGYIYKVIFNIEEATANYIAMLPLHLCSANGILYPLFFLLRNKVNKLLNTTFFSFMFFVGTLGAFLAVYIDAPKDVMGETISLLQYNVFEYWFKHGLVLAIPILFVLFKYYEPKYIDVFKASVLFLILILIAHVLNLICSNINFALGGNKVSNFFYTMHPNNMICLKQMYDLIGIPLVYLFPFTFVAIPLFSLMYVPFGIINLVKRKKAKTNNVNC